MKWSDWLVETGSLTSEQIEDACRLARLRSLALPDSLLSLGYADPWVITRAYSAERGYPLIDFYTDRIPEEAILAVPGVVARDLEVCPVAVVGPILWYATPYIDDADQRDRLCDILGRDARPMWAPRDWVAQAERRYYASCHVTECGSGWVMARYRDEDWNLMEGNRYQDYVKRRPPLKGDGLRT